MAAESPAGPAGAFFAWESQEGGRDACTLFNVNDIIKRRPIRTFFRDRQIHISADVAYALWRYCLATGDPAILLEGGAELMYECARFLVSWMYYKPGKDRYELLDVTGPDEYHERVHNDYFTNAICGYALDEDHQAGRRRPRPRPPRRQARSGRGSLRLLHEDGHRRPLRRGLRPIRDLERHLPNHHNRLMKGPLC